MPKNLQNQYVLPPNSSVSTGEVLSPTKFNATMQDLEAEQNATRSVAAGGTGATTPTAARTNLGIDVLLAEKLDADGSIAMSQVTNLQSNLDTQSSATGAVSDRVTNIEGTLSGFSGAGADLEYAKQLRATGVTTQEFDVLDGINASTTELNRLSGVTGNIQSQLNNIQSSVNTRAPTSSPTLTGTVNVSTLSLGNWTIQQSGSNLVFAYNGTNRLRLSSGGTLTAEGNVTAYGSA